MGNEFNSKKSNMGEWLCEELIEEILSRIPNITSLINCKYVSKSWSRLVTNVCCRRGPTVGFIALYSNLYPLTRASSELRLLHPPLMKENDDDNVDAKQARQVRRAILANKQPRLLQPEKRERDCIMEETRCLDLYTLTHLLDSCNGLILCRSSDEDVPYYYVGNPILNQWALLPCSPKQGHYITTAGFAFDGIQGHNYKILHLFLRETSTLITNRIQCQIFSSEKGQWREHQATILNSPITLSHCLKLVRESSIQNRHGLYRNGALHWTFTCDHKYMLVFYVENEVFRFIKLPGGGHDQNSTHADNRVAKCLWESKGFLHYAVSGAHNTFQVWKNTNDGDVDDKQHRYTDYGDVDDKQHRWVHIRTVMYHSMLPGNQLKNPKWRENLQDPKVLICKYDSCSRSVNCKINILYVPNELNNGSRVLNLGTMLTYLSCNGVLDESSAKELRVSWRYMRKNGAGISRSHFTGTLYPYVFNLVDLPIWDGCKLLKHPN